MNKEQEPISAHKLSKVITLKSRYDDNKIALQIGGKWYRMDVSELAPILKQYNFTAEEKRVHTYLTPIIEPCEICENADPGNCECCAHGGNIPPCDSRP